MIIFGLILSVLSLVVIAPIIKYLVIGVIVIGGLFVIALMIKIFQKIFKH